jgi:tetrahydromethanopterin S-methyltransferase subunit B
VRTRQTFNVTEEILMNNVFAVVLGLVVLFGVGVTVAQDTKEQAPTPKAEAQPGMGMGAQAPMSQIDEQMKKMQGLHDRMMNAKTPEERRRLMEEERKAMRESMGAMNRMMHGGGMGGGMMGQKGGPADPGAQMQMMQKRMDMMQMMMQMMMDQQDVAGGAKGHDAAPKK